MLNRVSADNFVSYWSAESSRQRELFFQESSKQSFCTLCVCGVFTSFTVGSKCCSIWIQFYFSAPALPEFFWSRSRQTARLYLKKTNNVYTTTQSTIYTALQCFEINIRGLQSAAPHPLSTGGVYKTLVTLTWHFIRYTFRASLILQRTPQRFWSTVTWRHHTVAADLSAAHPSSESPVQPQTQRSSIGLRSDDRGGHVSSLNSLSFSRNQFEFCDMVRFPTGSSQGWVHCGYKGMDVISCNIQVGCGV